MAAEPRLLSVAHGGEQIVHPKVKADACILLWMGGGMAAPDTFDPKKYVAFEPGVPVAKVESTFLAIDTVVDNIKITAGLENIARVIDHPDYRAELRAKGLKRAAEFSWIATARSTLKAYESAAASRRVQ
jgi:glycosyltransferase involved in cell wall biosynthesis